MNLKELFYIEDIYYLIDVGFEGYAPFYNKSFNALPNYFFSSSGTFYFPNNYNKLKTELIEGEKLFLYYYIDSSINMPDYTLYENYYDNLRHINNNQHFLVIPKNDEKEKSLVIRSKSIEQFWFKAYYCSNSDGTIPTVSINDYGDMELEDSKILTYYHYSDDIINLKFNSNFEFVFSYSFFDKVDDSISWINLENERTIIHYLNIKTAEINFNENLALVQFIPNYIKSSTRYFIVIGPKNTTFTLESFNNPCLLVKLITENSIEVKVYEAMGVGDEYIDVNIDIKDLITENENNKEFIVNVVSSELRFDKSLNIYKARLFETSNKIQFYDEIKFSGEDLYFDLDYYRPNNTSEIFIFYKKSISSNFNLIIETPNLEVKSFIVNDTSKYYLFQTSSDGPYSLNIISLEKNKSISGSFKILSTGIPFKLDIEQNMIEFDEVKTSIESSPLIFTFGLLKKNYIKKLNVDSDDPSKIISIKRNTESFISINNNNKYYTFEEGNTYSIQIKLQKLNENYILNRVELNNFSDDNIEYLRQSNIIVYNETGEDKFILFNLKDYSKLQIIQRNGTSIFNIANLTERQYKIFPREIQNIIFEKLENNNIEIKKKDNEYGLLMINLIKESTEIEFKLEEEDDDDGLSTFKIVIISISCFLFLVILAIIIIYLRKRKNNEEIENNFRAIKKDINEMQNEERLYEDN